MQEIQSLKNKILMLAIQGKLVPQMETEEPASVLLQKIQQEKEQLIKEKKIKKEENKNKGGNMKKKIMMLFVMALIAVTASAQKFALVDMEYILKNIPAYERANEQLSQVAKKWQAEVEAINTVAQTLYKNYQNEVVFLSQEQKKQRQEAIMEKEKEASELKKKYFGPEGELFKKRTSLMTPIQEEIYNAVKDIADMRGYSLVIDRASDTGIVFGSPKIDISNEVLRKLGYSN